MKRLSVIAMILALSMLLCGCDAAYSYTDELKRQYEDEVLEAASGRLAEEGLKGLEAELYAPGGLTRACTGWFQRGSRAAQYVYDADKDVLYSAVTRSGWCLEDSRQYVFDEVSAYLDGTGMRLESVRSISWPLAIDEYFYSVSTSDGKRIASDAEPRVSVRWLACPYFDYTMSDGDAKQFTSAMLHGFSDGFNDLSLVMRCMDFDDPTVQSELLAGTGFLSVFSGVESVLLYQEDRDDVYYKLSRQGDGTVSLDRYDRQFTGKSNSTWRKTPCTMPNT